MNLIIVVNDVSVNNLLEIFFALIIRPAFKLLLKFFYDRDNFDGERISFQNVLEFFVVKTVFSLLSNVSQVLSFFLIVSLGYELLRVNKSMFHLFINRLRENLRFKFYPKVLAFVYINFLEVLQP